MARRYYSSIAARTTLVSGVDDTTNTFIVNAVSGWPSSTPYTLIIDQDTVNEEVVEVTNRSGTTLTVTRGVDGTSAVAHSAGAVVNHGVSARDFDEPNSFLNGGSWGLITAKGDIVAGTGSGTFDNLAVGANGTVLRADSGETTGLEWYDVATDLGLKFDKRPDQNLQTGSTYTFAADDDGKLVTASGAASATYTIPPQSSVTWADDTVLRIVNLGAGAVTVAGGSGVTVTNTATTIGQYEAAAAIRTGSNAWTLVPFGGGEAGVGAAVISSPAKTGSYSSGGFTYDYWELTASTSLVVDTAGLADVLVVGGGGGAGSCAGGGGGAGGYLSVTDAYLTSGTLTVTVGAGGVGGPSSAFRGMGGNGISSRIGNYYAVGGGAAGSQLDGGGTEGAGLSGGSGGGAGGRTNISPVGGSGTSGQGNAGGNVVVANEGAGGGGANAVGGNQSGTTAGSGGNGIASTITGSSVTRAGGGGGGSSGGTAGSGGTGGGGNGTNNNTTGGSGTANTGGGGGGGGFASPDGGAGGAGGSGIVIVRVKV